MSSYGDEARGDINAYAKEKNAIIVDLRSDTVTKPSPAMRRAMFDAVVGDDVYGEDPTVNELEAKAAEMVGKEAALFVPSGTMGNLIAIMVHCNERGCEAYCGENFHMVLHEQGGAAQIAGVTICPIAQDENDHFCLEVLKSKFRTDRLHEPTSRLVILEYPSNGQIFDRDWFDKLLAMASERNLKLHMDGARLWNAVVELGDSAENIVEKFDSVMFCLSKGLGAPAGSLLCGSREFISQARRVRKVLGGGMRQVGVLAAAGIVALEESVPILKRDHARARIMEASINDHGLLLNKTANTNMLFLCLKATSRWDAKLLTKRLSTVFDDPDEPRVIVRVLALTERKIRLVFHRDITDYMLQAAIRKINYVLEE